MAELTDEAVRKLAEVLGRLESGASPQRQPAGPTGPSPMSRPSDLAETEAALLKLEKQMRRLNEATDETKESMSSFTESIEKSFQLDEFEAQTEHLRAREEALKNLKDVQERTGNSAEVLAAAEGAFASAMEDADEALEKTQKKLTGEKGLAKELDKVAQGFTGGGVKAGGFGEKLMTLSKKFKGVSATGGSMGKSIATATKGFVKSRIIVFFDKLIAATIELVKAQDKAISSFMQATGAGKQYNLEIARTQRRTAHAGVSAQEMGKAYNTLFDSFSAFTELNSEERNTIAETTSLLQKLGVDSGVTSKILDQMTRSLGLGVTEANAQMLRLAGTAKALGVSMRKMASDFQGAYKELAKYGEQAIDVFEGLAKQAKATGLEVNTLLGLAGKFDTFESAGQHVGKLNAVLGGPYLNSIDMLNATETERIDLLKQSVAAAGFQFDAMERFEKQALAKALGMSVDEASRVMKMQTAEMELQALQQEELAELARESQEIMAQLKSAFASLVVNFRPLIEGVIVPLVNGIGKFAQFMSTAESGLTRFVKVGLLAAGIAALVGAPFTGGASLLTYAAIIGAGGLAASFGGAGEAKAADDTGMKGFAAGTPGNSSVGSYFSSSPQRQFRMNEGGLHEGMVVGGPASQIDQTVIETHQQLRSREAALGTIAKGTTETNALLRQLLTKPQGNGKMSLVLDPGTGKEFSATVVESGMEASMFSPFTPGGG